MRIWTIQPVEVYEELLRAKVLFTDAKLSYHLREALKEKENGRYWTFLDSYDWLVSMMDKYNIEGRNESVKYPWWGWYIYDGKHSKPDLMSEGLGNPGEIAYCIELELDENEVLLSDHDLWHCVLNNSDIWKGYEEDDNFDRQFDLHEEFINQLSREDYIKYKLETWERIIGTLNKPDEFPDSKYKQATFWSLRLSDVISVKEFRCR